MTAATECGGRTIVVHGIASAGLEDTLYLWEGALDQGDVPPGQRVVRLVADLAGTPASVDEAAEILGISTGGA